MGLESNPHRGVYYLVVVVAGLLIVGIVALVRWLL
jgi:hypothetical protein